MMIRKSSCKHSKDHLKVFLMQYLMISIKLRITDFKLIYSNSLKRKPQIISKFGASHSRQYILIIYFKVIVHKFWILKWQMLLLPFKYARKNKIIFKIISLPKHRLHHSPFYIMLLLPVELNIRDCKLKLPFFLDLWNYFGISLLFQVSILRRF